MISSFLLVRNAKRTGLTLAVAAAFAFSVISVRAQTADDDSDNKNFDIKSSAGDVHVGSDVDLRQIGLPAYPGARLRTHDEHRNSANLALFTSAFGVKLLVVNYDSDDETGKIVSFYRGKLKKYGKVLECRASRRRDDINVNPDDQDSKRKELRCDGDNTGNVIELKVGTEDNQHMVAIEPAEKGPGSTFAIVYVHTRGKQAEI
jgi:hypothetical protein